MSSEPPRSLGVARGTDTRGKAESALLERCSRGLQGRCSALTGSRCARSKLQLRLRERSAPLSRRSLLCLSPARPRAAGPAPDRRPAAGNPSWVVRSRKPHARPRNRSRPLERQRLPSCDDSRHLPRRQALPTGLPFSLLLPHDPAGPSRPLGLPAEPSPALPPPAAESDSRGRLSPSSH